MRTLVFSRARPKPILLSSQALDGARTGNRMFLRFREGQGRAGALVSSRKFICLLGLLGPIRTLVRHSEFRGRRDRMAENCLMALLQEEVNRFLEAWMRVRQVVQAANFNQFRRAGLSATQFMTLNVVPEQGLTLSELARKLNLSASSLKKTIDSLADRGLVVRKPRATDARKNDILSTAKGKRLQNNASGEFHAFMAAIFKVMSQQERRGLVTGLERLLQIAAQDTHEQSTSPNHPAGGAPRETRNTRRSHHR